MNAELEIKLRRQIDELQKFIGPLVAAVKRDKERLDWLDVNCDWMPSDAMRKRLLTGQVLHDIRDYADKGMLADKTKAEDSGLETMKRINP